MHQTRRRALILRANALARARTLQTHLLGHDRLMFQPPPRGEPSGYLRLRAGLLVLEAPAVQADHPLRSREVSRVTNAGQSLPRRASSPVITDVCMKSSGLTPVSIVVDYLVHAVTALVMFR
jgi:hypothetical protein